MKTPLKTHGGKAYLASRIVATFPEHTHYVEPFAGGLSVLLAKPQQGSEVVNDVDETVSKFWQVLRHDFDEFKRLCDATPFSEVEYKRACKLLNMHRDGMGYHRVSVAWAFFVQARQSLAGRGDTFAPLSTSRTRRGMNEQASAWLSAVDGLADVHRRLRSVVVLNRDAVDVITKHDTASTLFYCDPPYHPSTRTAPDVYRHEMTAKQHAELLDVLVQCSGRVALSGYRCAAYDSALSSWNRHDFEMANHAAGGKSKRRMVECLWTNY